MVLPGHSSAENLKKDPEILLNATQTFGFVDAKHIVRGVPDLFGGSFICRGFARHCQYLHQCPAGAAQLEGQRFDVDARLCLVGPKACFNLPQAAFGQ